MIQWVYEGAATVRQVDGIFVATDDARIAQVCTGFGAKVIMTHKDHPSGTDRVGEACDLIGCQPDDIVVNVQGDEPLVDAPMIEHLVKALITHPEVGMATLAVQSDRREDYENPNVVKVLFDDRGRALYFSRSPIPFFRSTPPAGFSFWKHLGFYAYRYTFLRTFLSLPRSPLERCEQLEQLRALEAGYPIFVVPSPRDTIGIDEASDITRLMEYLKQHPKASAPAPVEIPPEG